MPRSSRFPRGPLLLLLVGCGGTQQGEVVPVDVAEVPTASVEEEARLGYFEALEAAWVGSVRREVELQDADEQRAMAVVRAQLDDLHALQAVCKREDRRTCRRVVDELTSHVEGHIGSSSVLEPARRQWQELGVELERLVDAHGRGDPDDETRARCLDARVETFRAYARAGQPPDTRDAWLTDPAAAQRGASPSLEESLRIMGELTMRICSGDATARVTPAPGVPTFGNFALAPGFMPDPHVVRGTSGGAINAATTDQRCAGWHAREPGHLFEAHGSFSRIRFLVRTTNAAEDTTLIIQRPDGTYTCDDDSEGMNPIVLIDNAPAGTYQIWVGSYSQGEGYRYVLGVTELSSVTAASLGNP